MATNSGIAGAAASARIPVMIVDDQPETRLGLALMVRRDPGLAIGLEAEDGRQAIDRIERAEAGASGFLLKDVRAGELCRAVRSVADGDAVLTPRVTREVLARSVRASGQDKRAAELRSAFRRLTDREREVCALVADGLSNAEIAERLTVQPASAKRAVTRILAKLGLRDRTQIAVKWYQAGL